MSPVLVVSRDASEAEWLAARREGIGASEIAAVLGISPWESSFSLYHHKVNGWELEDTDHMLAGRLMEPMLIRWFEEYGDPNENLIVKPGALYASADRPWQLATPDGLIYMTCEECDGNLFIRESDKIVHACPSCTDGTTGEIAAVLECKHPYDWEGFGEPGTDDVPAYYRAQCMQQLDVMEVDETILVAYADHQFRTYRIRRDADDVLMMRNAGASWQKRREAGEVPDLDGHTATLRTLKALHPSVEDIDIQVPVEFAEGYRRARALVARAEALRDRYDARARDLLGNGRRLLVGKKLVVSRSVYDQSGDTAELLALDGEEPVVDRLNPGRAKSYV